MRGRACQVAAECEDRSAKLQAAAQKKSPKGLRNSVVFQVMRISYVMVAMSILSAIAVAQSPAPAQQFPDATTVATRVGQTVMFQDEVKAVSYSRSTEGYYLSFGAPYPKQTLSVWIDNKTYDRLPYHHSMVGRTVSISGQLETSPTGPLIKLESSDHFQVLPTDEAILSKPTLDGKQDRPIHDRGVANLQARRLSTRARAPCLKRIISRAGRAIRDSRIAYDV